MRRKKKKKIRIRIEKKLDESNMNKNVLLSFMLFSYMLPILFVFYGRSSHSVSNIICNNRRNYILFFMFLMGIGTLLYEYERNDWVSLIIICILLHQPKRKMRNKNGLKKII